MSECAAAHKTVLMVNQSDTDLSAARICALRILINGMRANQSSGISETKTTTLVLKNNYWHLVGLRLGELDKHETPIKRNDFTRAHASEGGIYESLAACGH